MGLVQSAKLPIYIGYSVISLDLKDAKIITDINPIPIYRTDILEWDYIKIDPDEIDVIWASPPCIEYSIAKQTGVRKIDEASKIVFKALEIIENPQTGLLKKQHFLDGLDFIDVDYCKYGMPYRKRTRIRNNLNGLWTPRPLFKKGCGFMNGNRHRETAQRAPSNKTIVGQNTIHCLSKGICIEYLLN